MPRRPRIDAPGRRHHLLNRGQDRQPIFRRPQDYRFFLCLLAVAVRAGRIRIYSYCLMPNHFHLFVESLDGNISETMRWIQSRYAAYFNQAYQHSGHVFQGRFHSFPVLTVTYEYALVRYIELNPAVAGLCDDVLAYEWSSARWHASEGRRPLWLSKDLIRSYLIVLRSSGCSLEDAFRRVFRRRGAERSRKIVKGRVESRSRGADTLDHLCAADTEAWIRWLTDLASEPDLNPVRLPMADARSILEAVAEAEGSRPRLRLNTARARTSPWEAARVGLLRDMGGQSHARVAKILRVGHSTSERRYRLHRMALLQDGSYARLLAEIGQKALRACLGPVRDALPPSEA